MAPPNTLLANKHLGNLEKGIQATKRDVKIKETLGERSTKKIIGLWVMACGIGTILVVSVSISLLIINWRDQVLHSHHDLDGLNALPELSNSPVFLYTFILGLHLLVLGIVLFLNLDSRIMKMVESNVILAMAAYVTMLFLYSCFLVCIVSDLAAYISS